MNIFNIKLSITGIIIACLFLILALFIFSHKTDGQGGAMNLFVTFPWFFIAMDKIPLWIGIIPNTIISYFMGAGFEWLLKKLFGI
jgi:hypothetical protein